MGKDNKFGTFGGVFTPSVLTILGVIMYLRLPWVVGNAGLYMGLGIVLVAHVISVSTGLSISSIATDKSVGAGGPYYIVSRSLGLPIGGTLGLALFVGLAFSISLYVIGFSESLLLFFDFEPSPANIRICGSATLVLLASVAVISTAVAIKTQYLIFALIALSLVAIFSGSPSAPAQPALTPAEGAEDLGVLFGIFFPAVTGFTAGVNMSGDLRSPKRSIPRGTMAAIGAGMLVYVGLAVFLAFRVDRTLLLESPKLLQEVASVPWAVVAGIWGATLSSALGSILGAPRILQAVSADGITPRLFATGVGPSREPRNALVLSFLIALGGILIAELDVIARIVSMVFLATYGFLNISCAIESWASPDFRPDFRIPKTISLVGAATCLVVMIQLDLLAMAASVVLMAGLYAWLKQRQLALDAGDAWEGFWASLVRSGLHRLSQQRQQQRNWRPNVLMFRAQQQQGPLSQFANSLIAGNGLLTDFHVRPTEEKAQPQKGASATRRGSSPDADPRASAPPVGVFTKNLTSTDLSETIIGACQYHGFGGLAPNTVLLDWQDHQRDLDALARLIQRVGELDYNLLLHSTSSGSVKAPADRIDVWWQSGLGNFSLSIALVRFITAEQQWANTEVRFLLLSDDSSNNDILRTRARRLLSEARLDASLKVLNNALEARRLTDWVQKESHDAKVCLLGLAEELEKNNKDRLQRLDTLLCSLNSALLVHGNSSFEEVLNLGRAASQSLIPDAGPDSTDGIGPIDAGDNPTVVGLVEQQREAFESVVLAFQQHGVTRLYANQVALLRSLRSTSEKQLLALERGLAAGNPTKHRKLINRLQSAFLLEANKQVQLHLEQTLPEQRATLDGRIESFTQDERIAPDLTEQLIHIEGSFQEFEKRSDDSPALSRIKRRRRLAAWLRRKNPNYPVPLHRLRRHYYDQLKREGLREAVRRLTKDSHQLAVHLGKILNSGETSLTLLGGLAEGQALGTYLKEQRERTLKHYDDLIAHERQQVEASKKYLRQTALGLTQEYARDLQSIDIRSRARKERKPDKRAAAVRSELEQSANNWFSGQELLYQRAQLGLQVSGFQHRLAAIVQREKEALELELRTGTLKDCAAFLSQLEQVQSQLQANSLTPDAAPRPQFDAKPRFERLQFVERLQQETETSTQDLPESFETLSDATIERLEQHGYAPPERIQLSVRPLVKFLVESELIGASQATLEQFPGSERRAIMVGTDVARLVAFQLAEFEATSSASAADFSAHMLPAVDNGVERLQTEIEQLESLIDRVVSTVDTRLGAVLEATNAYELTHASDTLDQRLRLRRGQKAVTGLRGLLRRATDGLRHASVRLLYRGSASLLVARSLPARGGGAANLVERMLALVGRHQPSPAALEKLPFYYRQLFFGRSALNETFWVERTAELAVAKAALDNYRRGAKGALLIVGERGSGKSALWQRVAGRYLEGHQIFQVRPVPGGSADPAAMRLALLRAIALSPSLATGRSDQAVGSAQLNEAFARLPQRSVVVIDDLELWWERAENGNAAIDIVIDLISRHGDRCLFILCVNKFSFSLMQRMRPLAESAIGVVESGPMAAEDLKEVVGLRHGSTGVQYEVNGVEEEHLSAWASARLFASFFHYSRGLVGVALQAWISHVQRASKERIALSRPTLPQVEDLDELRVEQSALLLALCLHKQLHLSRLDRVVGQDQRSWRLNLDTLLRMGLVTEARPAVFEVNRFLQHLITERLRTKGYLP